MLRNFYGNVVLKYPLVFQLSILLFALFLGYQATKLEIDASAETLVLEDDQDLRYSRMINSRYESPEFLIITYTPTNDLLADETLDNIERLIKELTDLELIESVTSILDVPLFESPPKPVREMLKNVPTLTSPGTKKELAKTEFLKSPVYRNMLVSADFKTTGLQVDIVDDAKGKELVNRRYEFREQEREGTITPEGVAELGQLQRDLKKHRDIMRVKMHDTIIDIRSIMDKYRGEADLFLGGVSMISDDLASYVKSDLRTFGFAVLLFLVVTLWIIFRQLRWILIPVITCVVSVIATTGFLGMFGWEVTVISSNFISLQIIITMAITIHLIVRYRELISLNPDAEQKELVLDTVIFMAKPCLFMALTTIAGFSSLLLSKMLPVSNFGWMMAVGIALSLIITFLIFPTLLVRMDKVEPNRSFESQFRFTEKLADITENYQSTILILSFVLLGFSLFGASKLMVENSFINYFKESSEIYGGMKVIDQQLGGTTPLDVIIDFNVDEEANPAPDDTATLEDDEEFDDFEDEFEETANEVQYWFTSSRMETTEMVHDYLENLPEIGKVMSLGTILKVGRTLNDGEPLDNFLLALIYNELPEDYKDIVITPYVSIEQNQVRLAARILDSEPDLRRNELLKKIKLDLTEKLNLDEDKVHLTGLLVLYNNMLQSLFDSQILTLGVVILVLLLMLTILFRSPTIALIAIFPNILSISVVLGFMGWIKIPLDMMTITIASISVGIAVDNTIHYIYRFRNEFAKDRNYLNTMRRCHMSIGYAMYYTSVTVLIGFSILVFSNFIPSIYFGLLTCLAMTIALLSALTILPQLIILIKPLGPEGELAGS